MADEKVKTFRYPKDLARWDQSPGKGPRLRWYCPESSAVVGPVWWYLPRKAIPLSAIFPGDMGADWWVPGTGDRCAPRGQVCAGGEFRLSGFAWHFASPALQAPLLVVDCPTALSQIAHSAPERRKWKPVRLLAPSVPVPYHVGGPLLGSLGAHIACPSCALRPPGPVGLGSEPGCAPGEEDDEMGRESPLLTQQQPHHTPGVHCLLSSRPVELLESSRCRLPKWIFFMQGSSGRGYNLSSDIHRIIEIPQKVGLEVLGVTAPRPLHRCSASILHDANFRSVTSHCYFIMYLGDKGSAIGSS